MSLYVFFFYLVHSIVTEKEIFNGIFKAENLSDKVLVFFREILDLEQISIDNSNKQIISRFLDLNGDQIDQEAIELRNEMKQKLINIMPKENVVNLKQVTYQIIK